MATHRFDGRVSGARIKHRLGAKKLYLNVRGLDPGCKSSKEATYQKSQGRDNAVSCSKSNPRGNLGNGKCSFFRLANRSLNVMPRQDILAAKHEQMSR